MSKKVSYHNMLKQALNEWDTSKTVDVKGPMLDGILSYDGEDHLKTHKDAASILERYYFNEQADKGVELNDDGSNLDSDSMEHGEGEGTEQAGTSDETSIDGIHDEIEKEIAEEMASILEQDEEAAATPSKEEKEEKEEGEKEPASESEKIVSEVFSFLAEQDDENTGGDEEVEEQVEEQADLTEQDEDEDQAGEAGEDEEEEEEEEEVEENTIIERLIAEMEEENKTTDSMEHAEGAGTEQAGTGDDADQIPDREDDHMDFIERPKLEQLMQMLEEEEMGDEEEMGGESKEDKKKTNLDVDAEVKKESRSLREAAPLAKIAKKTKMGTDVNELEEAFKLFEAMEEDAEEDVVKRENPKNLRV